MFASEFPIEAGIEKRVIEQLHAYQPVSARLRPDNDFPDHSFFFPPEEISEIRRGRRSPQERLGFAVQIFFAREVGYSPRMREAVPDIVAAHLGHDLGLPVVSLDEYFANVSRVKRDITQSRAIAQLGPFSAVQSRLRQLAESNILEGKARPWIVRDVLREAHLCRARLPSTEALRKVLQEANRGAERRVIAFAAGALEDISRVDTLLSSSDGGISDLANLMGHVRLRSRSDLRTLCRRISVIRGLEIDHAKLARVPPRVLRWLYETTVRERPSRLMRKEASQRTAHVVAFCARTELELTDQVIDLVEQLFRDLQRDVLREGRAGLTKARDEVEGLRKAGRLVKSLHDVRTSPDSLVKMLSVLDATGDLGAIEASLAHVADALTIDEFEILRGKAAAIRGITRPFFATIDFQGPLESGELLEAIQVVRQMHHVRNFALPPNPPHAFMRRKWRDAIFGDERSPDGLLYEFETAHAAIRSLKRVGGIHARRSQSYDAFDALTPPPAELISEAPPALMHECRLASDYLVDRRKRLISGLEALAEAGVRGELAGARLVGGQVKVAAKRSTESTAERRWKAALLKRLEPVPITTVLHDIELATDFSSLFHHPAVQVIITGDDRLALLTALLADAMNLDTAEMARACPGVSRHKIEEMRTWYLRDESLLAAIGLLCDHQREEPLGEVWGDGRRSSSDGQAFGTRGRAKGRSKWNPKYGKDPVTVLYTHVADNYAAYYVQDIQSTQRDAAFVVDGLLRHMMSAPVEVHHTDTHGATDVVFGACSLLGIRLAPRLKDASARRLARPSPTFRCAPLRDSLGKSVRWELIDTHWDALTHLGKALKSSDRPPSVLLSRIAASTRGDGLGAALSELGRIERTLFLIDWFTDPALRDRIQAELNKGEAHNSLKRKVAHGNLGRLHDGTSMQARRRARSLILVLNAITLWNTRKLKSLMTAGEAQSPYLSSLSPLGWRHISFLGQYTWPT